LPEALSSEGPAEAAVGSQRHRASAAVAAIEKLFTGFSQMFD